MPPSAIGRLMIAITHPLKRCRGFTLIEILVVLVIASIIATFATVAVTGPMHNRRIAMTTERLQMLLAFAKQQAILQSTVLGVSFNTKGYTFYQYQGSSPFNPQRPPQWVKLKTDPILGFQSKPSAINITYQPSSNDPSEPTIIFYDSAEQTPFFINVTTQRSKKILQLQGRRNGTITLNQLEKSP